MSACTTPAVTQELVLASTTSTQDSGLLDFLIPHFEQLHDIDIKVIAVGSGEALDLGRGGDAHVLLVHAPAAEGRFMSSGHGISRKPVMTNDFVIAGPPSDPANIASVDPVDAFRRIASVEATFISRGDESGTHSKELAIWDDAGIEPTGDWYLSSGQGMAETIAIAAESDAYALTDSATLVVVSAGASLEVFVEGNPDLQNLYSVIVVKRSDRQREAATFSDWLISEEGQRLIGSFGQKDHGTSLFRPNP